MANWVVKAWRAYIQWCDHMGLTPENRRCCMPRLEDPPLVIKSPKITAQAQSTPLCKAHSSGKTPSE
ncbi:hypothetical protein [Shewanella glacialipiscicola]|uniref:hypothetical protein n=1 Tax=Shewanella glacialipiscicola TaxID=614069 RepID=UPI001C7ED18A|nr:hypothetical protein [Shewanella glacialipiscicola]MCL1086252.1 hypothetical protein [Shewanella glacialipiscicola]